MNYIKNHRVMALTLLLGLSIQGCVTSHMKNADKQAKETSEDEVTGLMGGLKIAADTKQEKQIFLAIINKDVEKLKRTYRAETTFNADLFKWLIDERIDTIIDDFEFIICNIEISNEILESVRMALRTKENSKKLLQHIVSYQKNPQTFLSLLAIRNNDAEKLRRTYRNDKTFIIELLNWLINERRNTLFDDVKFLARNVELSDTILDETVVPTIIKELGEQEVKKNLSPYITMYKQHGRGIFFPTPINQKTIGHVTYNLGENAYSAERKAGHYSDSEDEAAPHFNGVYNLTKYGILNIEDSTNQVYEGFDDKKIINNYIDSLSLIICDTLEQDAKYIYENLKKIHANFPYYSVTILCVALRQNDGKIKKFVFTNLPSVYQCTYQNPTKKCFATQEIIKNIVKSAHSKNYHVILAQQAHAEAELIQFLKERPNQYTHIVSMGCSRKHCIVCAGMLKDLFHEEITNRTSKSGVEGLFDNWYIPNALEVLLKNSNLDIKKKFVALETRETISKYWSSQGNHKQLSPINWKSRPWTRGNHKVKPIANGTDLNNKLTVPASSSSSSTTTTTTTTTTSENKSKEKKKPVKKAVLSDSSDESDSENESPKRKESTRISTKKTSNINKRTVTSDSEDRSSSEDESKNRKKKSNKDTTSKKSELANQRVSLKKRQSSDSSETDDESDRSSSEDESPKRKNKSK